jgi:hypothetical protein
LPAYLLLVAHGLGNIRSAPWRGALLAAITVYSLNALGTNYFTPYKEDWRAAMRTLTDARVPGDCVIVSAPDTNVSNAWDFYAGSGLKDETRLVNRSDSREVAPECARIWLMSYLRTPLNRGAGERLAGVIEQSHRLVRKDEFFWMALALYEPRDGQAEMP